MGVKTAVNTLVSPALLHTVIQAAASPAVVSIKISSTTISRPCTGAIQPCGPGAERNLERQSDRLTTLVRPSV